MFLLSLYTFKYLLPHCCFIMVLTAHIGLHLQDKSTSIFMCQGDLFLYLCTCKSLVPQYCVDWFCFCSSTLSPFYHSHVPIRLITVSLHLPIIADTVLFQYSVSVLIYTGLQVTATMKLANIWLQKYRRRIGKTIVTNCCRWYKFAWCDSR